MPAKDRLGFTLVEMLVAVTLVLIMMTMFAQIFQMAGASISKQRGMAENDQRSRTLQTILKADLDKRSYRWVYPFAANEVVSGPESFIGKRQGYFYISENNPTNKLDDVIQFTVMSTITDRNKDISPYYGRALNLAPFNITINQPDADDSQAVANNTGLSTVAEVCYFVRNGNLYRRQLMIREPISAFTVTPQPTDTSVIPPANGDLFDPNSSSTFIYTANNFFNHYDYTAYMGLNAFNVPFAHFLGSDSLDNSGKTILGVAIAKPQFRFGFSPSQIPGLTFPGRSKEFNGPATTASFIGRYTMQETSSPAFRYPQSLSSSGNVPTDPSLVLTQDPIDGTVIAPDDLSQGTRRGEDLLLSNVHAFDIQVWDELAQSFVNVGDPSLSANSFDFAPGNRYGAGIAIGVAPNPSYGPRINEDPTINAINAVFDTWHPFTNLSSTNDPSPSPNPSTGQTVADEPPYRPTYFRPAAISGGGGPFDRPNWTPGAQYRVGDIVFPSGPPGVDQGFGPPFTSPYPGRLPYGAPFYYRCIGANDIDSDGRTTTSTTAEPAWPKTASVKVPDNELLWQTVDNRKPLKAIKLEVRFIDPSTQQMRQVTIIQSLVD